MSERENGNGHQDGDGAESPAPVERRCSNCGHTGEPKGKGQCRGCGCFLPRNSAALIHGARAFVESGIVPEDIQGAAEDLRLAIVRDAGGEDKLDSLTRALLDKLIQTEIKCMLWLRHVDRETEQTKRGRDSLHRHGLEVDRWDRLAGRLAHRIAASKDDGTIDVTGWVEQQAAGGAS